MKHLLNSWLVIAMFTLLFIVSGTLSLPAPVENVSDGCPSKLEPITCESGQEVQYIAQNSVQCAHYVCRTISNDSDSNSDSKKSVLLPAVLGSVIPLAAIAAGIVFYLHRRHRKQRSMDAQHEDAKFMSSYNNLDDGSFGNGPMSPGVYSSTYSVSKWRDSAMRDTDISDSHASIPIIFSSDQGGDQPFGTRETKLFNGSDAPAYRETKLYNHGAQTDESRQWAAPNVVNLKQKPQLVVLNGNTAGPALEVDTGKVREPSLNDSSCSEPESLATPLTPETPYASAFSEVATPMSSEKPRIVQVGRPQIVRNMEVGQGSDAQVPGSPLRVAANNWESGSEHSSDYSDSEQSGSEEESGSESEAESGEESGSESEEESGSESESGESGSDASDSEGEEKDGDSGSEVSDDDDDDNEVDERDQGEDSGPEGSDFHSESESESGSESGSESEYESGSESDYDDDDDDDEQESEHESDYSEDDKDGDDDDGSASESDSEASDDEQAEAANNGSRPDSNSSNPKFKGAQEAQSRLSLGPAFKLETSSLDTFSNELLSAAESISLK